MAYALDLSDAGHWYTQYRRLMRHWKALYPGDILEVDYDLLVREPRSTISGLAEFVGLTWEDHMLNFHRSSAPVKTASVWQVRQPIHARSSGRWRNYERHLRAVSEILAPAQSE
jgi:hypothetical protein